MVKRWAIFDLDNTIADMSARLEASTVNGKLNYGKFHDVDLVRQDEPMQETIDLINDLANFNVGIFILTGRFESTLAVTKEWLMFHNVSYDKLVMKSYKDTYVKSNTWKEKQLLKFIEENNITSEHIILAVEDYKPNQTMFESWGIPCLDPLYNLNTIANG
jgi:phosphoglycolate phosphatase-like HAD superfamily hydrolase